MKKTLLFIVFLTFTIFNLFLTACDKGEDNNSDSPVEIEVIEKRDTIIYNEGDTIRYDENGDTLRFETKLDTIKHDKNVDTLRCETKTDTIKHDKKIDTLKGETQVDTIIYAKQKEIVTDFDELSYDDILIEDAFVMEKHGNNSFQGLAIYENYLLQTYHTKNYVDVYDLTNNQFVFSMEQNAEGNVHCNNVDFGGFYKSTDPFPLLYLEYKGAKHTTGVYRIVNKTGNYELEKIQVLTFSGCTSAISNNNRETSEMYITFVNDNNASGTNTIAKIDIPDFLSGNQTISLEPALVKEMFNVESNKVKQDATIYKNKLFQLKGGAGTGELWIFDLNKRQTIITIDWNEIGLKGEPEGIGWYKDHLVISNHYGQVYNMYFVK